MSLGKWGLVTQQTLNNWQIIDSNSFTLVEKKPKTRNTRARLRSRPSLNSHMDRLNDWAPDRLREESLMDADSNYSVSVFRISLNLSYGVSSCVDSVPCLHRNLPVLIQFPDFRWISLCWFSFCLQRNLPVLIQLMSVIHISRWRRYYGSR